MIRILFVDDNIERTQEMICTLDEYKISHISDYAISKDDALRKLSCNQFDLVVVDIILPDNLRTPGLSNSAGKEILNEISYGRNIVPPLYVLGITSDNETYENVKDFFEEKFIPLSVWESDNSTWKAKFISKIKYIQKLSKNYTPINTNKVDTVIIATVDDEYRALNRLPIEWEDYIIDGDPLICSKGTLVDAKGNTKKLLKVKLPEMGMSAATHITTRIINLFDPQTIVMVGICGGNKTEVSLGDIIVAEKTWDYGSGKIKKSCSSDSNFSILPNQININTYLKSEIERNSKIVNKVYNSWNEEKGDTKISSVKIGALPSGSAVIADKDVINNIKEHQYRKLLGIDMETYGVYFACHNQGKSVRYVSIKSVSDLADEHKDDTYHDYCSYASAMFTFELISLGIL